jgi:two-component system, OmpR family, phosphate regulon sensor histidine kinase PhoR
MDVKPKILVVDDEKGLRLGTKRLLENEGYLVTTAENGSEGIRAGTTEEYDIAVIDLKMPDFDGIHVLQEIRKVHPNTICFIATAYASYDTAIESTKLGAFGYIPKPFTSDEFLSQIKTGCEKRSMLLEMEKWRKEREERLLEVAFEKTRLNTIINSITDGVLVVNRNGEAVLYNPSALKYLQLSSIKIEEYIIDKLHPVIVLLFNAFLDKGIFESKSISRQIEVIPGTLFIEATSSPVPHPDGSLAGVVVVIKDITELKKIESLKSQFVSMVSHELKAPVSAVHGFIDLILSNKVPVSEEQKTDFLKRSQLTT